MNLRRKVLILLSSIAAMGVISPFAALRKWGSRVWAQTKEVLPKGFPREKIANLNPAEVDPRNLEIDPLDRFETMGPTEVAIDAADFRLKVTGEIHRPLSLTYDEILKLPCVTENVLLICPGFFSNYGRWTGVHLKELLAVAQPKKEAAYLDIKGYQKDLRIPLDSISRKKIILAYQVNGERLPRKHGFPLRLVYEGVYGDDWIKYVSEIVVVPMPKPGP